MASMYYNTLLLSHYYELAQAFTLHLKVKQLLFFIAVTGTGSLKVFTITIQPIGDVLGDKRPNFG